jgi:hypothetical protein
VERGVKGLAERYERSCLGPLFTVDTAEDA